MQGMQWNIRAVDTCGQKGHGDVSRAVERHKGCCRFAHGSERTAFLISGTADHLPSFGLINIRPWELRGHEGIALRWLREVGSRFCALNQRLCFGQQGFGPLIGGKPLVLE